MVVVAVTDVIMNSAQYQKILEENLWPSVCVLKLKHIWVMQQDNDLKNTSKPTSECLTKKKVLKST